MADVIETRLLEARTSRLDPVDFLSNLVSDELVRRQDRLHARRIKTAEFRDHSKTLDTFDFASNPKIEKHLVFELTTAHFVARHEDVLFLGRPGTGKSQALRSH